MGVSTASNGGIGTDRLTDARIRATRPGASIRKLSDGKGMYLAVKTNGAKLWRLKYRHGGKERVYSIGAFPEVGLAEARGARDQAREWLRQGKDPVIERRVVKANASTQQATTFRVIAEEWLARQHFSIRHLAAQRTRLDRDLLPHLGGLPVAEITTALVLEALRRVERRGTLETAAKCRRLVSQIFRFAVQTARAESDPAALLNGALAPPRTQHRATVAPRQMPALFKALIAVPAEINTKLALYWLMLTASRTVEMRFATWGEIDGKVWRVPSKRMKMKHEHLVALSLQAQAVLARARAIRTGPSDEAFLFPGFTRHGALSENALLALLARAGYFGRQTAHGFRASFSTWAHETHEADPDVIEACLAHVKEGVRGVYNRSTYLSRRLELLQAWADQLETWGMRLP
ncbi:MAG: integrase arm-type DNA-binding domain-containing protein [Casimicrobiaceae bacterium]